MQNAHHHDAVATPYGMGARLHSGRQFSGQPLMAPVSPTALADRLLLSMDHFSDDHVQWIFRRAEEHIRGTSKPILHTPPLLGLVFLEASLRTVNGFAAAAYRLAGSHLVVQEQRASDMSLAESPHDTLRTMAGFAPVVVMRHGDALDDTVIPREAGSWIISGGHRGQQPEHPTQTLIDVFGFEREMGPLSEAVVAICGDPSMRTVGSLLRWFERHPPAALIFVTTPRCWRELTLSPQLAAISEYRPRLDVPDVDALYLAGMPIQFCELHEREAFTLTSEVFASAKSGMLASAPMPVIDELDVPTRNHPQFRGFVHSDWGVPVRMAVLESVLAIAQKVRP